MIEVKQVKVGEASAQDFLAFPQTIYPKVSLRQDFSEEEAQLEGSHPLSHYYQFEAFVAYRKQEVVARVALILYPDSPVAYAGYFEAEQDEEAVKILFDWLKKRASQSGKTKLIGPVNASFWLGYRMKLDQFDHSFYTSEPGGLSYYPALWQAAGFTLSEEYHSVFYQQVPAHDQQSRLAKRYRQFCEKGYTILSPKAKDWDQVSVQVFELLSKLYAAFPIYHPIQKSEFATLFKSYQQVLDFSMVKLAYHEDQLVGFMICVPDYGKWTHGRMTPLRLFHLLKIRHKANRYVILYLGVDQNHLGLGSALAYPIYKAIQERGAYGIGALIHQGKVTEHYAPKLKEDLRRYGLFELHLGSDSV